MAAVFKKNNPGDESFRDKIATVDKEGKRVWVYPKKPSGFFTDRRHLFGYSLLLLFFVIPFIRIGGEPFLLLNIPERQFVIFGVVFWPQDFHLFLLATLTLVLFVILFTVIYGRIFCGWACPQTIFMELVFRKIEYWIEGDRNKQMMLDRAPLSARKIFIKTVKHGVFFLISFIIANLFLTYIIGTEAWWEIITDNPAEHAGGLAAMLIFTGVFYYVYARFREQVCTTICPYGRLQGVMFDKNTIAVAYDYVRGEPRGKIEHHHAGEEPAVAKGDCIDCKLCVHVCPTGIDIRDGIQMECINCTACIDACDEVMLKVHRPTGLIRYASEAGISERKPFRFTKRVIGYSVVLTILVVIMTLLLATRPDVETSVLRTPGMLYQQPAKGLYSNLYNFKVVNKTGKSFPIHFEIENMEGEIKTVGQSPEALAKAITEGVLFIQLPQSSIRSMKTNVEIGVYTGSQRIETVKTTFIGPAL